MADHPGFSWRSVKKLMLFVTNGKWRKKEDTLGLHGKISIPTDFSFLCVMGSVAIFGQARIKKYQRRSRAVVSAFTKRSMAALAIAVISCPKRHRMRPAFGEIKAAARRCAGFGDIADVFEVFVQNLVEHTIRNASESSFSALWKASSRRGYRVSRNGLRTVDYGNREYKTFLLAMATLRPNVGVLLARVSEKVPSLHPLHEDTETSLLNTGDIVEVFFSGLRGDRMLWLEYLVEDPTQLPALLNVFESMMQLIHLLDALLTGRVKYRAHQRSTNQSLRRINGAEYPGLADFMSDWSAETATRGIIFADFLQAFQAAA